MLTAEVRDFAVAKWKSYHANPRAFVHDLFRDKNGQPVELEDYQAAIMEGIAAGDDVTVRSGHGVGKTTVDAFIVYWYLLTRPFSKVPTTAPTLRQVKDILWAEIAKWHQGFRLKEHLVLSKTKMSVRGHEADWHAIGIASNKPQNMEGFHAPFVLFIVDEAKGVSNPIYDAIDGALTTGGQRLYTSTPGSRQGKFYESHFGRIAKFFRQIHINGEDAPRVDRKWLAQKAEEWGVTSPIYQAKVLGEFPNEGDDILIRLDWILAAELAGQAQRCATCGKLEGECEHETLEPAIKHASRKVLGCDVARFGVDETATAFGSSTRIDWIKTWTKTDLVTTTQRLVDLYEGEALGAQTIGVDDTGLGGGVTDMLMKLHQIPTMPVIFGSKSALDTDDRKEHFQNNKAWLCWKFRMALEDNFRARERGEVGTFGLCDDDRLKGQLSNLRTRHMPKGQLAIKDPDDPSIAAADMPKGLKASPDRAHAVVIAYHASTGATLAVGSFAPPAPAPRADQNYRRLSGFIFGNRRR